MRLFRRNKYEYQIFALSRVAIGEQKGIEKLEDDGWELCGVINSPAKVWCAQNSTTVPMRRKRK